MIKFGIRQNLFYPLMFIFFIFARRIIKHYIERKDHYNFNGPFLLVLLMYIFEVIISTIIYFRNQKREKRELTEKLYSNRRLKLINKEEIIKRADNICKILILIIFASYFDFIGSINRRYLIPKLYRLSNKNYENTDNRGRSLEIFISSLLCYYTLNIRIYKHQKISLAIILFCLSIFIITEIIVYFQKDEKMDIFYCLGLIFFSGICRAFLDTTEKYLFEYNFVDPFKLLILEGLFNTLFISLFYNFDQPKNELLNLVDKDDFFMICFLLLLYSICSAFKKVYRIHTVLLFSPMTRALAESFCDPLFIIFSLKDENDFIINDDKESPEPNLYYFGITFFCSIIIILSSCVYNEVFVLYYCGMEHDTYFEINNRARSIEIPSPNEKDSNDSEENSEDDSLENKEK